MRILSMITLPLCAASVAFTGCRFLRYLKPKLPPAFTTTTSLDVNFASCDPRTGSTCLDVEAGNVELTFEETVHYNFGDTVSRTEWLALQDSWSSLGYIRVGEVMQVYALAMIHQMHCVDALGRAIAEHAHDDGDPGDPGHLLHCLSYLRQLFLCQADTTLEPYDFLTRDYSTHPVGVTRVCRDWSAVYGGMGKNYREWRSWETTSNDTQPTA